MRITQELQSKVSRALDTKYQPELKALDDAYSAFVAQKTPELLQELTTVCYDHPFIAEIMNNYRYGCNDLPSIVNDYLHKPACKEYIAYCEDRNAIFERRKQESESIIIRISYLKDFDALQATFKELGFSL